MKKTKHQQAHICVVFVDGLLIEHISIQVEDGSFKFDLSGDAISPSSELQPSRDNI